MGLTFVFVIDRCSIYTGKLTNISYIGNFLGSVYTGFHFIQGSVSTGCTVLSFIWELSGVQSRSNLIWLNTKILQHIDQVFMSNFYIF